MGTITIVLLFCILLALVVWVTLVINIVKDIPKLHDKLKKITELLEDLTVSVEQLDNFSSSEVHTLKLQLANMKSRAVASENQVKTLKAKYNVPVGRKSNNGTYVK